MEQARPAARWLLLAASAYNFAFAIWSGLAPVEFFGLFGMTPPDYPSPWPVSALVVAACGLFYLYGAWRPEQGRWAVAVGLATKVIGPLLTVYFIWIGEMSPRMYPLIVAGDIAWWFPLLWIVLGGWRWRSAAIVWLSFALHLLANFALLAIAPGTELNPDMAARQQFVTGNVGLWTFAWTLWAASSLSLVALCAAWGAAMAKQVGRPVLIALGVGIVAVSACFDLTGEGVMIVWGTNPENTVAQFAAAMRTYQWLSPIIANGGYPIGGLILSAVAWSTNWQRGVGGGLGFFMWGVAIVLTVVSIFELPLAMAASGAVVMFAFLGWSAILARRLQPTSLD